MAGETGRAISSGITVTQIGRRAVPTRPIRAAAVLIRGQLIKPALKPALMSTPRRCTGRIAAGGMTDEPRRNARRDGRARRPASGVPPTSAMIKPDRRGAGSGDTVVKDEWMAAARNVMAWGEAIEAEPVQREGGRCGRAGGEGYREEEYREWVGGWGRGIGRSG